VPLQTATWAQTPLGTGELTFVAMPQLVTVRGFPLHDIYLFPRSVHESLPDLSFPKAPRRTGSVL
jgi:hypothetical protein